MKLTLLPTLPLNPALPAPNLLGPPMNFCLIAICCRRSSLDSEEVAIIKKLVVVSFNGIGTTVSYKYEYGREFGAGAVTRSIVVLRRVTIQYLLRVPFDHLDYSFASYPADDRPPTFIPYMVKPTLLLP